MNTKLAIRTFSISLLAIATSVAEDQPVKSGYEVKNRSSFGTSAEARAPFWPIGYVKRSKATPTSAAPVLAKVTLDASQFKITSILLGSPSLAVINGRAYGEGEFMKGAKSAASGGQAAVRIRVQQISDGGVVLQCAEQSITVPFQRPSLAAKQPSAELSFEDR